MNWFSKVPYYLQQVLRELRDNSNYIQTGCAALRTLVSSGDIVVRLKRIHKFPIVVVFPAATPYSPPVVYLVDHTFNQEEAETVSRHDELGARRQVSRSARFYYHRHQNIDGSLCLLDHNDLHGEQPELVSVASAIERTMQWFKGHVMGNFPLDSREAELYYHFPNRQDDIQLLLTDPFYDTTLEAGEICFVLAQNVFNYHRKHYIGAHVLGLSGGVLTSHHAPSVINRLSETEVINDPTQIATRSEAFTEGLSSGALLHGFWWHVQEEPKPFRDVDELVQVLGGEKGLDRLTSALAEDLRRSREPLIGLRFSNRHGAIEWLFCRLMKNGIEHAILGPADMGELESRVRARRVLALMSKAFTEDYFHMRNRGRADRTTLRDASLAFVGAGSLGSAIIDNLTKAGLGKLTIIDKGMMEAHNIIRHACGLNTVGLHKVGAVGHDVVKLHNPFVEFEMKPADIMLSPIAPLFGHSSIGVSTIADDNVEGFLNEECMSLNKSVYYARVLRGGKAGRIFRVIPGVDACKECLAFYAQEGDALFPTIPEDPSTAAITNECNNPVRPASNADIAVVAGLASRIIIDDLQNQGSNNHWVWHTENLGGFLQLQDNETGRLIATRIPIHPKCRLCNHHSHAVVIAEDSLSLMKTLSIQTNGNETGGVLIGFTAVDGTTVVVQATEPGPKAICRPDYFERDIDYCQAKLEAAAVSFGNRGQYVGEWHFHPSGVNEPSALDMQSLTEIGLQANYATEQPLLVILSESLEAAFTLHPVYAGFIRCSHSVINLEEALLLEPRPGK